MQGALAIAGALFCSCLAVATGRAQAEPESRTPSAPTDDVVVMVCIDDSGGGFAGEADCDWQPLSNARAGAALSPMTVNGRRRPGRMRIAASLARPSPQADPDRPTDLSLTAVEDMVPGLDEKVARILIWSLHYQAVPDGSYSWRLDEESPYRRAQYEALGLARPDLKPLLHHHRFKGAGLRISLQY